MPGLAATAEQAFIRPAPRNGAQRAALRAIVAAAEDRKSFAAVIGEPGTGKTTLLGMTAALLDHPPIQVIRADAAGEAMSSRRLTEQIAGLADPDDPTAALELALERLLMPPPPRTRTILMIDDAHLLLDDALAYLQLTSGLEEAAGLQIVFAARPEFRLLRDSDLLGKLRERVSIRATLDGPASVPCVDLAVVPDRQPRQLPAALWASPWTGRRYAVTSAFALTIVLASMGPTARDHVPAPGSPHATAPAATLRADVPRPPRGLAAALPAAPAPAPRPKPPHATPPASARAAEPMVNLGQPLIALVKSESEGPPADFMAAVPLPPASSDDSTAPFDAPPPPAAKNSEAAPAPTRAPTPAPTLAATPALSAEMIASLVSHGDDMLRQGDIGAARLLYARAADAGSSAAAIASGKTFDPRFLSDMGAEGIAPDPPTAAVWYRRALALGDQNAARLLARLSANSAP